MRFEEVTLNYLDKAVADWGEMVVSRGKIHYLRDLSGFAAIDDEGYVLGLILYHVHKDECEIVTMNSYRENTGIGSQLIELVKDRMKQNPIKRLWLITTNDNVKAIRYYQKRGFDMKCIHYNAVNEARLLKPSIPKIGIDGISIQDEIEFEMYFIEGTVNP